MAHTVNKLANLTYNQVSNGGNTHCTLPKTLSRMFPYTMQLAIEDDLVRPCFQKFKDINTVDRVKMDALLLKKKMYGVI